MREITEYIIKFRYGLEVECKKELVRCKDCRNAVVYDDNEVVCDHIDSNGNDKHIADWFCADGKRAES